MSGRQRPSRREDRGATLVIVALFITALLIVVALVIDLGFVRENRQSAKAASDPAVAAGIRFLDNGAGQVQPWRGICAARDYLLVNDAEFVGMTETYADGAGTPVAGNPCSSIPATICSESSAATWGVLTGSVDGGRIKVTIANGYTLPDPSFAEDADEYAGDDGSGPCDNLAVIIEKDQSAYFGGVAGASGYETTIRSVARLVQGTTGEVTAALILLERTDCAALLLEGNSGARVDVQGNATDPGVIHADSIGNGGNCSSQNIFHVNGNPSAPVIVASRAPTGNTPGQITARALTGAAGADPSVVASPVPDEVCVQQVPSDCGATPPFGAGTIEGRQLVGRARVDARYREPILDLQATADARFAWSSAADLPAGWTERTECGNTPTTFTETRIWLNCGGGEFRGNGKTFTSAVQEVVIDGYVLVDSNNQTLRFDDVDSLYIAGRPGGAGIEFKGSNNDILINDGALTDTDGDGEVCDQRHAATPGARTELVVGSGSILAEGGSGKVLRMCSTTVFLRDNASGDCAVPSSDGAAPYDNGCGGRIRVAGKNGLEWMAPNVNTTTSPTPSQLDDFEDLAFWSETQNGNQIEGGGGVFLAGIFFTPNADPFRVGGNGAYDIEDAQFITRRLTVAGNGTLVMKPQPQNSIQIPELGGFTLVR